MRDQAKVKLAQQKSREFEDKQIAKSRTANFPPEFFRGAVWGGRSRTNHFKKFAKANFLKWCRGGVWGGLPPQESPLPVPCPPGGSGGLRPPGISVNYPCLASAAAVPCPRALPPIFFRPNFFVRIFSSEFFRRNFFVGIFLSEFFRLNFFRPSSVRRPSVVHPSSVRRPSVRPWSHL